MYSDRVAATGRKRSVKDRLGGGTDGSSNYAGQSTLKRPRQGDEKWKHDLYDDEEEGEAPRVSNGQAGVQDLRMKLQRTSYRKSQSGHDSQTGVRDLREKLSGPTQSRPVNVEAAQRLVSAVKGNSAPKPVPAVKPVTQPVPAAPTKPVQKQAPLAEERSVAGLLQSLGLGKYLIIFQAEEVDMAALRHMSDDDLKALGIPMGPRKKILLAMDSNAKR